MASRLVVLVTALAILLPNMGLLICHPTTWRSYQPLYLPGPQFCPDTGRTVCTAVDYYPTDRIYNLLTSTRSQVFNLTSLFVDERNGDVEPNTSQLPAHPPYYYQNGYGGNQPPPGGRFSPAGRLTSWNQPNGPPSSDGAAYPQNPRWRQLPSTENQEPQNGDTYNHNPNDRRFNGRIRMQNQRNTLSYNNASSRAQTNSGNAFRTNTIHNTQNNNGQPSPHYVQQQPVPDDQIHHAQNPYWGGETTQRHQDKGYDSREKSNYHSGQRGSDGLYQIQAPQILQNTKGGNIKRPPHNNPGTGQSWNGPTNHQTYSNDDYQHQSEEVNYHNGVKRGKRNQDVEVACPVQSTYVPPRAALSDQSEWKYIINVPERDQRFSQVVRVDVCLTEGQPCSSRLALPFGFESRCRQKYIKKKLLSLNPDGQGTAEDNFFIPSCCVCEIVRANKK